MNFTTKAIAPNKRPRILEAGALSIYSFLGDPDEIASKKMEGLQKSGIHMSFGCISKLGNRPPPNPKGPNPPQPFWFNMALHLWSSELRWRWSLNIYEHLPTLPQEAQQHFLTLAVDFLPHFKAKSERIQKRKTTADRGSAVGKQRLDGVMVCVA